MCLDAIGDWTDIGKNGTWGMMVEGDVSDGDFMYTAILNGEEFVCTERGCDFSNTEY